MTKDNSQSTFEARRNFLKLSACGAMTSASSLSMLMNSTMTSAVMASPPVIPPTGGYKALVCLFFNGGLDSFNVLTPFGEAQNDASYAEYASTRTGAALKRSLAWDGAWSGTDYGYLNPIVDNVAGRTFGLHPRFTYLKQIYDAGHATLVANCGVLVEPLANKNEYLDAAKIKPFRIYNHGYWQRHWQSAIPTSEIQTKGWAGKLADLFTDSGTAAAQSNVYTAISTAGQSLLLTGRRISPYPIFSVTSVGPPNNGGALLLTGVTSPSNAYDRIYSKAHADLTNQTYSDLLEKTIRNKKVEAGEAASAFQTAFLNSNSYLPGAPAVQFSTTGVGAALSAVARSISIASDPAAVAPLKQDRQIFLVQVSGWDHHSNLLSNLNGMIPAIDTGLKAFYDFLVTKGLLNRVTLFSFSEFGRTLSFNGSGTDDAWGGNQIVMGGAVNGMAHHGEA